MLTFFLNVNVFLTFFSNFSYFCSPLLQSFVQFVHSLFLSAAIGRGPRICLSCCCSCSFPFFSCPLQKKLKRKNYPWPGIIPGSYSTPAKHSINWATATLLHKLLFLSFFLSRRIWRQNCSKGNVGIFEMTESGVF